MFTPKKASDEAAKASNRAEKKINTYLLHYFKKSKKICLKTVKATAKKGNSICTVRLPEIDERFDQRKIYEHVKEEMEELGYKVEIQSRPYILFEELKLFRSLQISWSN